MKTEDLRYFDAMMKEWSRQRAEGITALGWTEWMNEVRPAPGRGEKDAAGIVNLDGILGRSGEGVRLG